MNQPFHKRLAASLLFGLFLVAANPAISQGKRVACPNDDCGCYYNGEYKTDEMGNSYDGYTCNCNSNHKWWVKKNPTPQSPASKVTCHIDSCGCYYNGEYKTDDLGRPYDGYTCNCNSSHKYWVRK